jgi:transcriptional regulator with XRE-family HTH domain
MGLCRLDFVADTDRRIRDAMREAMRDQELTVTEIAARLGWKHSSVSQILSGTRGIVPESLLKVLEVLGLELEVRSSQVPEED